MVKGLAKSETAYAMISEIKYVDASTAKDLTAGYSPVTLEVYPTNSVRGELK